MKIGTADDLKTDPRGKLTQNGRLMEAALRDFMTKRRLLSGDAKRMNTIARLHAATDKISTSGGVLLVSAPNLIMGTGESMSYA